MSFYERGYREYKRKYLLAMDGSNPDKVDSDDEMSIEEFPDDYQSFDTPEELEIIDNLNNMIMRKETMDPLSENFSQVVRDIGSQGQARGKIYDISEIDNSLFTTIKKHPSKHKILMLKNYNDFDMFTQKFGKMNKKNNNVYIEWRKVSNMYKGVYVMSSVIGDRYEDMPYMGRTKSSWINYDYDYIDDVVIFIKQRSLMMSRHISEPFNGRIVDGYSIDEDEFVKISDPVTNDKILLLDNVKSFDKFTNKYGFLIKNKKSQSVDIDWHKVNKDYDGFSIDKDNDFHEDRYEIAFFKDNRYQSWWINNQIEGGIVYLFN